jgi:hypothetical protein
VRLNIFVSAGASVVEVVAGADGGAVVVGDVVGAEVVVAGGAVKVGAAAVVGVGAGAAVVGVVGAGAAVVGVVVVGACVVEVVAEAAGSTASAGTVAMPPSDTASTQASTGLRRDEVVLLIDSLPAVPRPQPLSAIHRPKWTRKS